MRTVIFVATAAELLPNDAIEFGKELVKVIGTDPITPDELLPIVTEDFNGEQYIDYIIPTRQFVIVRTEEWHADRH